MDLTRGPAQLPADIDDQLGFLGEMLRRVIQSLFQDEEDALVPTYRAVDILDSLEAERLRATTVCRPLRP